MRILKVLDFDEIDGKWLTNIEWRFWLQIVYIDLDSQMYLIQLQNIFEGYNQANSVPLAKWMHFGHFGSCF